jgi:hypothetical protein
MPSRASSRSPRLNLRAASLITALAVTLTAGLVFGLGHRSVFVELQITLLILAVTLFCFLSAGLYWGFRPGSKPGYGLFAAGADAGSAMPFTAGDLPDLSGFGDVGGGDDPISCLLSIVGWLVMTVFLLVALTVVAAVLWGVLLALAGALFWLFSQALRQVFAHSRRCRGKLLLSIGYALGFTLLYTGWLFGVMWLARLLIA